MMEKKMMEDIKVGNDLKVSFFDIKGAIPCVKVIIARKGKEIARFRSKTPFDAMERLVKILAIEEEWRVVLE